MSDFWCPSGDDGFVNNCSLNFYLLPAVKLTCCIYPMAGESINLLPDWLQFKVDNLQKVLNVSFLYPSVQAIVFWTSLHIFIWISFMNILILCSVLAGFLFQLKSLGTAPSMPRIKQEFWFRCRRYRLRPMSLLQMTIAWTTWPDSEAALFLANFRAWSCAKTRWKTIQ